MDLLAELHRQTGFELAPKAVANGVFTTEFGGSPWRRILGASPSNGKHPEEKPHQSELMGLCIDRVVNGYSVSASSSPSDDAEADEQRPDCESTGFGDRPRAKIVERKPTSCPAIPRYFGTDKRCGTQDASKTTRETRVGRRIECE